MPTTESLTLRIPFVFEGHAQGPFAVALLVLAMTAIVVAICVNRGRGAGPP